MHLGVCLEWGSFLLFLHLFFAGVLRTCVSMYVYIAPVAQKQACVRHIHVFVVVLACVEEICVCWFGLYITDL